MESDKKKKEVFSAATNAEWGKRINSFASLLIFTDFIDLDLC
jgi:hypothetical protein